MTDLAISHVRISSQREQAPFREFHQGVWLCAKLTWHFCRSSGVMGLTKVVGKLFVNSSFNKDEITVVW
jgi:hypothetical protein